MIKRFAALVGALALTLVVAAPVFAQSLSQPTPIAWDDAQYQGSDADCAGTNLQPGQVLWHFVGHFSVDNPVATFTFADQTFTDISPDVVVDHYEAHWNIVTDETSLLSASVSPDTDVDGFNLSHICSSPPVVTPEAPMSALLLLSAGVTALGFFGLWMRRTSPLA